MSFLLEENQVLQKIIFLSANYLETYMYLELITTELTLTDVLLIYMTVLYT